MFGKLRILSIGGLVVITMLIMGTYAALPVFANRYSSSSYTIDASTMNTFGGSGGSSSYGLVSSGGEAVIGNGSGGSYIVGQGYVAQLEDSAPSLKIAVQPSGLSAYFPFEEGDGFLTYDNGINNGMGTLTNGPTWTTGKVGGAIDFDGDDDVVHIQDSAAVSPTSAMTVSAWINGSNRNNVLLGNAATILAKGTDGGDLADNPPYTLFLINGSVYFATCSDGASTVTSLWNGSISNDTWYHVVGTFDGTNQRLYVNGVLRDTDAQTDINDNNATLRIGMQKDGYDRYYNGIVDEVKIYNRALSLEEIQYEYAAQNAGNRAALALGTIVPGISQTSLFDTIVETNVADYSLSISQNQDLTNGGYTIPAISGSIGSPQSWTEGTTKGLGFTLVSGNGISGVWNSGSNYAPLPGSSTTFHSRTGGAAGKEVISMRLRADVQATQVAGAYTNTMTITGTTTP